MKKFDFDIQEELKKLPAKPGVYIMHNSNDDIIYVGKAVKLCNRVRSYFQPSRRHTPKIASMVSQVAYFEYIVVDNEREALVLECNLIKEYRPRYNTMLKDDKTYPYIKVTVKEDYPRVLFTRQVKKDGARYFGPYTSAYAVKDVIDLIHKAFQIRNCNKNMANIKPEERVCLYYHIGQCSGPCKGLISREEYRKSVNDALDFLEGDYARITDILKARMEEASAKLEFEDAAKYRDLIASVEKLSERQKVNDNEGDDRDVIGMARTADDTVTAVFFVRDGKVVGREHFHMQNTEQEDDESVITAFVKQYYSGTPYLPPEILTQVPVSDQEALEDWLSEKRGGRVHFHTPVKGDKKRIMDLAVRNAQVIITADLEKIRRQEARTIGAVHEIEKLTGLKNLHRMEAYDISHISGVMTVASMVVFEDGIAKKSDYRRFRIQSVKGPDDYQSMREVLTRRFRHGLDEIKERQDQGLEKELGGFSVFPDVIMMDGGRGQVNIALEVLDELGLNIPVCGMVKDDRHHTRGLYYNNKEVPFNGRTEGFLLVTRMQDEAHRFAIEYHRSLRSREQTRSVLDDIKGVGPAKRKALMMYFKGVEAIQQAPVEELEKVDGISESLAREIYSFFH